MANQKLTSLPVLTAATTDDLLYVVDNPLSSAASKQITFDNLQKSITVTGTLTEINVSGDTVANSDKAFYFGGKTTEGSWRIVRDGNNLAFQRYESSIWVEKGLISP